jgi:hypothetical protein
MKDTFIEYIDKKVGDELSISLSLEEIQSATPTIVSNSNSH